MSTNVQESNLANNFSEVLKQRDGDCMVVDFILTVLVKHMVFRMNNHTHISSDYSYDDFNYLEKSWSSGTPSPILKQIFLECKLSEISQMKTFMDFIHKLTFDLSPIRETRDITKLTAILRGDTMTDIAKRWARVLLYFSELGSSQLDQALLIQHATWLHNYLVHNALHEKPFVNISTAKKYRWKETTETKLISQ
jgi:hypothetical protein